MGEGYQPGSREDFDRLYRTAYPRVYRTLSVILRDPDEAEDCAQDAFVQAFQAWKRWRPDAPACCGLPSARSPRRKTSLMGIAPTSGKKPEEVAWSSLAINRPPAPGFAAAVKSIISLF